MDKTSNLPATVETDWSERQIVESLGFDLRSPPARLTDGQIAVLDRIAATPLPALPACSETHFAKCMRALATLPRQSSDDLRGEMQFNLYHRMLGQYPDQAMSFLCETALVECDWFPTIKQCLEIIGRWKRGDQPVLDRACAETLARRERQTRFDEAMARLSAGALDQAAIDALPDRWKRIAETRSLLWRHADGSYSLRAQPEAAAPTDDTVADITDRLAERFRSKRDLGEAA